MSEARQSYVLYGRPGSGSSACEALLTLAAMDFSLIDFQKRAEGTLPPEIHALNPLGQVPVLKLPDGSLMTESAAIMIYLADLNADKGFAPAPYDRERALYLRLMLFVATNTYMTDLRWFYPERYSTDATDAFAIKAKAGLDQEQNWLALESIISSEGTALQSGFSAVDLYLTMLVSWSEIANFDVRFPNLWKIFSRCTQINEIEAIWQRHGVLGG